MCRSTTRPWCTDTRLFFGRDSIRGGWFRVRTSISESDLESARFLDLVGAGPHGVSIGTTEEYGMAAHVMSITVALFTIEMHIFVGITAASRLMLPGIGDCAAMPHPQGARALPWRGLALEPARDRLMALPGAARPAAIRRGVNQAWAEHLAVELGAAEEEARTLEGAAIGDWQRT
jgi:hypothetical protein